MYRMHRACMQSAMYNRSEVWKLYCAFEFISVMKASKQVTINVKNLDPSLRLRGWHRVYALY